MSFVIHKFPGHNQDSNLLNVGFLAESAEPDTVESKTASVKTSQPAGATPSDVDEIAGLLARAENPNLVFSVHGFNTPRPEALLTFGSQFDIVDRDPSITCDTVCVAYRWPSEKLGRPEGCYWTAAPYFLRVLSLFALALLVYGLAALPYGVPAMIGGGILLVFVLTLTALRFSVYFRDQYRAAHYGAPDLLDIIRQIDKRLLELQPDKRHHVGLSFIGHSMGGYVVTNTIRVLSDVFWDNPDGSGSHPTKGLIGNVFQLRNLVLVSPDIPAEAIMSNSANFLKSALKRFQEVYLFCNEGDEVLRQISTAVNYFAFPTGDRRFGYRLGNIGVAGKPYGVSYRANWGLDDLQLGFVSVARLFEMLDINPEAQDVARRFSYFDCTDSIDAAGKGLLTSATARMRFRTECAFSHLLLLLHYLGLPGRVDVHSGYFKHEPLAQLIYRLAALGWDRTDAAGSINQLCHRLHIKAARS